MAYVVCESRESRPATTCPGGEEFEITGLGDISTSKRLPNGRPGGAAAQRLSDLTWALCILRKGYRNGTRARDDSFFQKGTTELPGSGGLGTESRQQIASHPPVLGAGLVGLSICRIW